MHILLPDEGEIEVLRERGTRAAHDRVSYLPEERGLYKRMTVRRLLRYYGALKGARQPGLDQIDRPVVGAAGALGLDRSQDRKPVQRDGPEGSVHRGGPEPAAALDPGRAVLRSRPRQHGSAQGRGPGPEESGDDDCLLHARHARRRAALRPDFHDLQGKEGARRHARRDPVERSVSTPFVSRPRVVWMPSRAWTDVDEITDLGNLQEVRWAGDPQELLESLLSRTRITRFEVTRPSLHDIFVRIAAAPTGPVTRSRPLHPDFRKIWIVAHDRIRLVGAHQVVHRWASCSCRCLSPRRCCFSVRDAAGGYQAAHDCRDRPAPGALPRRSRRRPRRTTPSGRRQGKNGPPRISRRGGAAQAGRWPDAAVEARPLGSDPAAASSTRTSVIPPGVSRAGVDACAAAGARISFGQSQ